MDPYKSEASAQHKEEEFLQDEPCKGEEESGRENIQQTALIIKRKKSPAKREK